MKLSLVFAAAFTALGTLSGCAVSAGEPDVSSSAQSDLTKLKVSVLGDIDVGGSMFGGDQRAEGALHDYRAFKFAITAGSAVDVEVNGSGSTEALILDERRNVLATSKLVDGKAVLHGVQFGKDGTYLIAFHETGPEAAKDSTWIYLTRNFESAPITHLACKTREKMDGQIQTIDMDIAYLNDKKVAPELLLAKDSDPDVPSYVTGPEEHGYVSTLNENIGFTIQDGRLVISGDADGLYLVELVLFQNSDLKKGFFRIYNNSLDKDMYSEVDCTPKESIGR